MVENTKRLLPITPLRDKIIYVNIIDLVWDIRDSHMSNLWYTYGSLILYRCRTVFERMANLQLRRPPAERRFGHIRERYFGLAH